MIENYGNGDAPCGQCGKHIEDILIDLDSVEDDGNGGRWYKGIPDQVCPFCGALNWYHVPKKEEEQYYFQFQEEIQPIEKDNN